MPIHSRLYHTFCITIILAILFSGFALPSVSAQGLDGIKRQVNTQTDKVSFIGPENERDFFASVKGHTGAVQDPNSTPLPTETPIPTETVEATTTPSSTETAISTENVSVPGETSDESTPLTGATWYVAVTGNDSNSCSTTDAPCATIDMALVKAFAEDTIKVSEGTYTYNLPNGNVININKSITISGGWDLGFNAQVGFSTINGQNRNVGISVNNPSTIETVSIDRFIARNSEIGIFNREQLTISNSSIHSNRYSGIAHYGPSLILNNAVISNNWGSGLSLGTSTVIMNNVTISQNRATSSGGGIHYESHGSGTLLIQLSNTIIAGNTAPRSPDCDGPITSLGHNIIGNTSGCTITAGIGDQLNVDPKLAAFIPELGYHLLLSNSPAIDAGDSCYETTDLRGAAHLGACDIGAFEYVPTGPAASISIVDGNYQSATPDSGLDPLQVIVQDSFGTPVEGVEITFAAPSNGPSLLFTSNNSNTTSQQTNGSGIAITSQMTANHQPGPYIVSVSAPGIESSANFNLENIAWYVTPSGLDTNSCRTPGSACATINGALAKVAIYRGKIFVAAGVYTGSGDQVVSINKTVILSGGWDLTFTNQTGVSTINGQNKRRGLNVYNNTLVSIEKFIIQNGMSIKNGGGIYNDGTLSLKGVAIINNVAVHGAGIYNTGELTLDSTTIAGNNASVQGGGIYNKAYSYVYNTTISGNSTKSRGGGIYNEFTQPGQSEKSVVTKNSIIAGNTITGTSSGNYGPDCAEKITSLGNNIIGSTSGCTVLATTGDKFNVNPKLSSLIPALGYQPLQAGSPAINAGSSTICFAEDQRGAPRIGACDIGAYEYRAPEAVVSIRAAIDHLRLDPSSPATPALQVVAIDQWGTPVSGVTVTFTAPFTGPSGVFTTGTNTISVTTDVNGIASVGFTTNQELGSYIIDAYSSALDMHTSIFAENFAWLVANTGDDANDCYTPVTPCATINGAIEKASAGDTILVAEGRYIKTGYDFTGRIVFIDKKVKIVGSWNTSFTGPSGASIIDGEYMYAGFSNAASGTILSRFIIHHTNGGIFNSLGSLTVDRISVINNKGTGVNNFMGNIVIQNTTISQNQGVGVNNSEGSAIVKNSTITHNKVTYATSSGGGVQVVNGTLTISNSILYGNTAAIGSDCYVYTTNSFIISNGYNIIGTTADCRITANSGDKFNIDPLLVPLLPFGYQPLSSGSPAIHAGNPATCTQSDQRGLPRLTNGKCDIGAYEYRPAGAAIQIVGVNTETQRAPINTSFPVNLQVVAVDEYGTPVSGVVVQFSLPTDGPSALFAGSSTVLTTTNSNGVASSPVVTTNSELGDYVATASVNGFPTEVTFPLHNGAWLVSAADGSDANDCLTPASPCASIPGVLDKKEFNSGETIWLTEGTYSRATEYYIQEKVTIIGGWNASFTSTGGATVLNELYTTSSSEKIHIRQVIIQGGGAGITNYGVLMLENVVIYQTGRGIRNNGNGNLTLINVTMSGNSDTALQNNGGSALLISSTITRNRGYVVGGIQNDAGTVQLKDTILAGNIATYPQSYASEDCQGKFISLGHNIIGTMGSYDSITRSYDCRASWVSGDIIGNDNKRIPLNQILNANISQDPYTGQWVHALNSESLAIDAGSDDCPQTDQRVLARPQGAACDIGAFEAEYTLVDVTIGKSDIGSFRLVTHGSRRQSFTGVDNGPVKIEHTVNTPLMVAERLIYKVNGVNTSFSEMMGLPNSELDNVYWLPWYNNVNLDTQLRFANATNNPATVTITIGGVAQAPINLAAGESTRVSYTGVDAGPVKIESTQNIVASERIIYKVNGVNTSFSEMMALPEKQLDNVYWLPWYNNVNLDSQLRFANVTANPATVTITIGGVAQAPINLAAGESTRISYPGVDAGPVKIESTQPIVASERVIYKVNNVHTSFSEVMALPNNQLSSTYWLPWYNNLTLDTQLRIANVSNNPATVTVTIGGVAQAPINLAAGESTRVSYPSIDNGPVQIQSTQPIVAAERVIYKVNNVNTSFSEMMALPNNLLSTLYWFPWYNNTGLDTQLRFGVP